MVLDPLSAFAVACNVLQVLEIGTKLALNVTEQVKNGGGLTRDLQQLRDNSQKIKELNADLEATLSASPTTSKLSVSEQRLMEANQECIRVSKQFAGLLEGLEVKKPKALLEILRKSTKAYWSREEIEATRKALSQARANLILAALIHMRSQQATGVQETKHVIQDTSFQLEQRLTSVIESSWTQTKAEIQRVTKQFENTYVDRDSTTVSKIWASNQDAMEALSQKLDSIYLTNQQERKEALEMQKSLAQRKTLDSLNFTDIFRRLDQITSAEGKTYEWMLQPLTTQGQRWSCFYSWLQAPEGSQRIYWVQGKPGSGKSTLMKFLDENLDENLDANTGMHAWCEDLPVYRARFYFWQSGTTLQKSLSGFYRAILLELLSQRQDIISEVVTAEKWEAACLPTSSPLTWRTSDLRSSLRNTISFLCQDAKVFLIIDGIDEFDGSDDEQEQLLDFLMDLRLAKNVKLCVSSRPWNIFQDRFGKVPQLRLEDLTRDDMVITVNALLQRSARWLDLCTTYPSQTESLISDIVAKAEGVFLWIRLVMRDLLRGIRDGDSLAQLEQTLVSIPGDLTEYFKRMVDAIEPRYREEASKMLQIACWEEKAFLSTHGLRLLQLSFVEEQAVDFATSPNFDFSMFDLNKPGRLDMLRARIDSALRKLHSRCMGLLECSYQNIDAVDSGPEERRKHITVVGEVNLADIEEVFGLRVDFIHRSLKEFLETPQMQSFLYSHTNGHFDPRRFLCNARLVQFMALSSYTPTVGKAIGFAGNLLPMLSVRGTSRWSATIFSIMKTNLNRLAETGWAENDHDHEWYILSSLRSWKSECSNSLSLAIDFHLTSYIMDNLTAEHIKTKRGRPILDYILRPRFTGAWKLRCCNRQPDIELLQAALTRGADPNEKQGPMGVTVWESFLCFWANYCRLSVISAHSKVDEECLASMTQALVVLLKAGAKPVIDWPVLTLDHDFEQFERISYTGPRDRLSRFKTLWPNVAPFEIDGRKLKNPTSYPVSHLLASTQRFQDSTYDKFLEDLRALEHDYFEKHSLLTDSVAAKKNDLTA